MLKKWWMLALMMTLALSLTSCGKKKSNLLSGGGDIFECAGDDWAFDVRVVPQNSFYYLEIIPYSLNEEGDFSQIVLAQGQYGVTAIDVDVIKTYTGMYSGRPIVAGPIDYDKFDGSWNLVMWQYGYAGITDFLTFLGASGGKGTACELSFGEYSDADF